MHRVEVQVHFVRVKIKHTYSDYPQLPHQNNILDKADLSAHAELHHLVYSVCLQLDVCECFGATAAFILPLPLPLYIVAKITGDRPLFPGASAQTLLSARAAGEVVWRRWHPTRTGFIYSAPSMRRRGEKRRQWKATVIAINCQSHLHPEAQPPPSTLNKHSLKMEAMAAQWLAGRIWVWVPEGLCELAWSLVSLYVGTS